ncbi:MAG: hypothetical protein ACOX7F_01665 [Eubacteriales bacterium]|jgi:hypothetical protein
MIFAVLKRAWLLYRENWLALFPYFGVYSLIIALGVYGVSLLNIHRAGGFLPVFLLSPVLLLMMKRCFELVIQREIRTSMDVGKIYQLSFFTTMLPMGIKAFFPVVPYVGGLLDLIVTFAMLYALGLFFLTGYFFMLNPALSVRQMITLSCQHMRGSILPLAALGVLFGIISLPVVILMLLMPGTIATLVVQTVAMTALLPLVLLVEGVYAARMLSGQDARLRLNELDLKSFFEEKVEQGVGAIEPEKIDVGFVEEVQAIPSQEAPPKPRKPHKVPRQENYTAEREEYAAPVAREPSHSRKKPENPLQWSGEDAIDPSFFQAASVSSRPKSHPAAPREEAVEKPVGEVHSLAQLRSVGPVSRKRVFRAEPHQEMDLQQQLGELLPWSFLMECEPVVDGYREALRGTVKKFRRTKTGEPYGAHFTRVEAEGNTFAWLMEMKLQDGKIALQVELYINDPNW